MKSEKIIISNMMGMDIEASGAFCDEAMKYPCHIEFKYDSDSSANAKSMLSVLGASVSYGQEIEIICDGEQEEEALEGLKKLIENHFEK